MRIFRKELPDHLASHQRISAKANAYSERLVGTVRRECLDFMIPLNERHVRKTLRSWVDHYNKGRPHSRVWSLLMRLPVISVKPVSGQFPDCELAPVWSTLRRYRGFIREEPL